MAEVFVRNRRLSSRRLGRDLGEIPLSTGEIEYLSRQDETARRRQRLLQVREQEKRAAQLVTQRYRENLKKLQGYRLKYAQQEHKHQQDVLLSALHEKYQCSLQGMGTAQRNAREKVVELIELAQIEKRKWAFNRRGEKERFDDAVDAVHEDAAGRLARRREVEQNLLRLKEMSVRQRSEASARAKRELDMQLQLQRAQEEAQRYRLQHLDREEFSFPRKTRNDVKAYHLTRTHCVTLSPRGNTKAATTAARGTTDGYKEVKVVRHNRVQRTVPSAIDQAETYRLEMERQREQERQQREENVRVAESRGDEALHVVDSIREGERALDWLASMDRHARAKVTLRTEPDHRSAATRAQTNGDLPVDGDGSDAFARLFGIDDTVDLLRVSGTDDDPLDDPLDGPQRVIAGRVDSTDGSDDLLFLGLENRFIKEQDGVKDRDPEQSVKYDEGDVQDARRRSLERLEKLLNECAQKTTSRFDEDNTIDAATAKSRRRFSGERRENAVPAGNDTIKAQSSVANTQRPHSDSSLENFNPEVLDDPHLMNLRPCDGLQMDDLSSLNHMQRDLGAMESSSSSSIQQYSLPLSDSFSSMNDSRVGRESIDTLTNQLVPIFPRRRRSSQDSTVVDETDSRKLSPPSPLGETSILLDGLAPQEAPVELRHGQEVSTDRATQQTQDVAREDLQRPRTTREVASADHGGGDGRVGNVNAGRGHQDPTEVTTGEQQKVQNVSFSSDSSSDVSAYMYLEKMRKMVGVSNIPTRSQRRDSRSLHSSESASVSSIDIAESSVMQSKARPRFHGNSTGRRDSIGSSSSSTPSVDARFEYLVNMTAVAGNALPLHHNLSPASAPRQDTRLPPSQVSLRFYSSDSDSEVSRGESGRYITHRGEESTEARTPSMKEGADTGTQQPDSQILRIPFGAVDFTIPPSPLFESSSTSIRSNQSNATSKNVDEEKADRNEPIPQFNLEDLEMRLASLPPPPFGDLDMSQPPAPLAWINSDDESQDKDRAMSASEFMSPDFQSAEQDTPAGTPQKNGEALFVAFGESGPHGTSPQTNLEEASLADAFRARHPSFHRRAESTKGLLEQRRQQLEQRRAAESHDNELAQSRGSGQARPPLPTASRLKPPRGNTSPSRPIQSASPAALLMPKPELLDRLASGQRAKISPEEMRARTQRLYKQLPEVTERLRQDDVLERRRQRLTELREREKTRRQQQQRQHQMS